MITITNLLFPPRCPSCDEILYSREIPLGFCQACFRQIHFIGNRCCSICGTYIRSPYTSICADCKKRPRTFTKARALFFYKGKIKEAMYRFKYSNRRCYGKIFARYCAKYLGNYIRSTKAEVIIPVPMYDHKKKVRGYNQAEVFGRALAQETGLKYDENLVERSRNTAPMKTLGQLNRKLNLQNAFNIKKNGVKYHKVLLVDDIFTTGATMDQIAKALLSFGVKEVYCLSICGGENK